MKNLTYLVSVFAFTIQRPIFAKLGTELVQVRRGWGEVGVESQWIQAKVSLTLWWGRFSLNFRRNLCFLRHKRWLETGCVKAHRLHSWVERLRAQRAALGDLWDIDVYLRVTDRGSSRRVDERLLVHGGVSIREARGAFWHRISVVERVIVGLVHQVGFLFVAVVAAFRFLVGGMVVCNRAWCCATRTFLALCVVVVVAAVKVVWDTVWENHVFFLILNRVVSHFWNFICLLRSEFLKLRGWESRLDLNLRIRGVAVDHNSRGGFWLGRRGVVSWAVMSVVLGIASWTDVRFWLVTMRLKVVASKTGFFLVLASRFRLSSSELRLSEWGTHWWWWGFSLVGVEFIYVVHNMCFLSER